MEVPAIIPENFQTPANFQAANINKREKIKVFGKHHISRTY